MKFEDFVARASEHEVHIHDVKRFSQEEFLGPGATGSCAPMSAVWLRFRHDRGLRQSTLDNFGHLREEIRTLAAEYEKSSAYWPLSTYLERHRYKTLDCKTACKLDDVRDAIRCPGYFLVGFSGTGVAGHMIAVDAISFTIFDPNYGEMRLEGPAKTAACTKKLIQCCYSKSAGKPTYLKSLYL
jgi:hypothetical protein